MGSSARSRFHFPPRYFPFACPLRLCCFITVRAATSLARLPYRPDFWAERLIFSYCRCSFEPTPRRCRFFAIIFLWVPPSDVAAAPGVRPACLCKKAPPAEILSTPAHPRLLTATWKIDGGGAASRTKKLRLLPTARFALERRRYETVAWFAP